MSDPKFSRIQIFNVIQYDNLEKIIRQLAFGIFNILDQKQIRSKNKMSAFGVPIYRQLKS